MANKQWYCTTLRQENGQEVQENMSIALKSSDKILIEDSKSKEKKRSAISWITCQRKHGTFVKEGKKTCIGRLTNCFFTHSFRCLFFIR